MDGVERPRAITPDDEPPSKQILHREAKRVKLNGSRVVSSKLVNKHKTLNNIRCHKNVLKMKIMRQSFMTSTNDRESRTITNNDR